MAPPGTQVYTRLNERLGLSDHLMALNVMLATIATNLKAFGSCQDVVEQTLNLFQVRGVPGLQRQGLSLGAGRRTAWHQGCAAWAAGLLGRSLMVYALAAGPCGGLHERQAAAEAGLGGLHPRQPQRRQLQLPR